MKRIFTFLFIALGTTTFLFAQVKMTKVSHGFLNGQNHECQAVQYQAPGNAGENLVWDFSKVVLMNESKSVSDLVENYSESNIKASRNDGCEFFFNITENANEYWGYKVGKTKLQLTEPIIKTKYPQTYNTQFSGNYEGTVTIEGSDYVYPINGTYSTHADATGTIILPEDITLPALRIRTTEGNQSFELVKYLWYAQNVRLPLFVTMEEYTIAADGTRALQNAKSYLNTQVKTSLVKNPADAQHVADNFSYKVFPNPFQNEIKLDYFVPEKTLVTIELFNANGNKLTTLTSQVQTGSQTLSKDVSRYAQLPGIYLLKITAGEKTYIEKLVKTY